MTARVAALLVHPVKACAALPVAAARLGRDGLEGDRRWLVCDREGRAVTQRDEPRLALVRPSLPGGELALEAPGLPRLVPVAGDERAQVVVWGRAVPARRARPEDDAWFTRFLGREVALVRRDERAPGGEDDPGFADEEPLLVAAQESLAALDAELAAPVPMARFRPNLVLEGTGAPFAEEGWSGLVLGEGPGGAEVELVRRCERCVVVTVDPATGVRVPGEPLRTLAARHGGAFGMRGRTSRAGLVRVGDPAFPRPAPDGR